MLRRNTHREKRKADRAANLSVVSDHVRYGLQQEVLGALSHNGGEVVAVHRHDYAQHQVTYAVDGRLITVINPGFPWTDTAWIPTGSIVTSGTDLAAGP